MIGGKIAAYDSTGAEGDDGAGLKPKVDDDMPYPPPQTTRPLSSQQLSLVYSLPSNDVCFECNSPSRPDWASVTYGIVLCLDCAGIHRGLGTHLSFVRSLTMDDMTDEQYGRMVHGGNAKFREYWEAHCKDKDSELLSDESPSTSDELRRKVRVKYESIAARVYRETLSVHAKASFKSASSSRRPLALYQSMPIPASPELLAERVSLPEESPPSIQQLLKVQAWPFVLSTIRSRKSRLQYLMWGILGITVAYGVHWYGLHQKGQGKNSTITSSLPSVNPVAHDYMGATVSDEQSNSVYDLFALGILVLTVGLPYFKLRRFALKIARGQLNNRHDAFKSARNLLIDRIAMGRAQRMEKCDVYYPPIAEGEEPRAKCGFIFYPGALVDRTAYAPIASRMSESGILVAVANLEPFRVISSLHDYNLKKEVMRILSDSILLSNQGVWTVDEWSIGGHSIGGHVAIVAVANELSSTIKKVVLWGVLSYPLPAVYPYRQTLREIKDVDALVVNGSNDEIIKSTVFGKDKIQQFEDKMPPRGCPGKSRGHTHHVTIEGGNHSGCSHYGPQSFPLPDGIRTITLEQQQRRMAEATVDFLLGEAEKPKSD